jgi:hypothetical protein
VIVPGKRFCKQCGAALASPEPSAVLDPEPKEQGELAPGESTIPVFESVHATSPPLERSAREQTITLIDSTSSEILPALPLHAEPETAPDGDFNPASREEPKLSSDEEEFRPLFKFSGDEQEPSPVLPLPADHPASDPDKVSFGRSELGDSDAEMSPSFKNRPVTRRRTLLQVLGAVCTAALLGAAWFAVTHYYGKHRPVQIATEPTPPAAVAVSNAVQTSTPSPQKATEIPIPKEKPAPLKQEAGGHDAPTRHPVPKADAAIIHPPLPKNQGGNCSLDSNMLSRMLDQADRNREQGKYADAARQYRSVQGCDSNNVRARSGLDLTMLDIQHQ